MSLLLYAHPFSSYCQKVLIALYENDTKFEFRMLAPGEDRNLAEQAALWPLRLMPVLVDDGRTVVEASIIVTPRLQHAGPVR
jgi:glutathione S-transferase